MIIRYSYAEIYHRSISEANQCSKSTIIQRESILEITICIAQCKHNYDMVLYCIWLNREKTHRAMKEVICTKITLHYTKCNHGGASVWIIHKDVLWYGHYGRFAINWHLGNLRKLKHHMSLNSYIWQVSFVE